MEVFAPPQSPSYNPTRQKRYRTLDAQFGDGYMQEAGDGINATPTTLNLSWENLTIEEGDAIEEFMDSHAGFVRFLYAFPATAPAMKWVCKEISRDDKDFNVVNISCKLERRFDP